ncbi:putative late blight resistance protein -like protein R1B-14-like [Capsicum annuum]|nr:putative late blight resistance protein -like protein R1B-14-like [Capsicum annuum]
MRFFRMYVEMLRDFHGLIVNGCVEHEIVQCVLPQFQLMAERVALFLWDDRLDGDFRLYKLAHLLMKFIPIELEVMPICCTNLKASPSAEVGCFIKQLIETSPEFLENIWFIYKSTWEVSTLVQDLEEKSRNEVSTDETSRATRDLLENIELLKEDLKFVYLEAPDSYQCCFPMNDGPLFMHLLHIHLNDLLYSNAYSIALIKEEIALVKEDLEFIRSFYVNVEQRLYKNPWARVLDAAYKAKDVIDSIIVRDNGFKEETIWLISQLTSGPKDLDAVSINGMPCSGKTTLADKAYNDESVCRHFDLRAWCTVDQDYDEKEVLVKLFNQVNGSDLKFSEEIDVADELQKKLYGKSWKLLEKRAFGNESCPDELLDVGKEIAQNCKGLPLVADLIAGVITGLEKEKSVWLEVRNNLSSFILNSEVDVMKVIELSYDHLPLQLMPCFLYLASFSKDTEIHRKVLKMYWRAEGLVEQTEMMSVDEVTEIYMDNLISSSLVIAFNEMGYYPTFQLHDLVHDFCLIKAKEEKLFGRISSSDQSSSSDLMPRRVTILFDKEHFGPNNFVLLDSKMKRHSGKHLCSLLITGDLRLLRVLDLSTSFMRVKDSLLNEIGMLNHLRFLRIGTEVKPLPSSFSNLWNLEILFVTNKGLIMVLLPSIWDLIKLRELSIYACSFFAMETNEPILIAEDAKLDNLRELGKLVLSYSKDTEDIFKRFPNLQCLSFVLKESWDYSKSNIGS